MPKRRKVLIGLGTSVAVAGCSGASESEPEPENESEPENVGNESEATNESETQEPVEEAKAVFEITETVDGKTFSGNEETYINVTITNTGNAKEEQTIEIVSQNKSSTESFELEPGESRELTVETINPSKIESGTYEYTVRTNNTEINSRYTTKNLFEQSITKAEKNFKRALREYGKSTDVEDGTFIHVLPSTNLESNNAWDYLNKASDILWEDAREYANTAKQNKKVSEYRSYEDLIRVMERIQKDIFRAYSVFAPIESKAGYDRGELDSAKQEYEELAPEVEENEMYMEELETKFNQLEWQIEQVATTFDGLANLEGATDPSLLTPTQLQVALGDFESVIEELEDETSAPPEDMTDEEFLEQVREFHETTDEALNDITQGSDN